MQIASVCMEATRVWSTVSMKERPSKEWLRSYLQGEALSIYKAWDWKDAIWSVFSYFSWDAYGDKVRGRERVFQRDAREGVYVLPPYPLTLASFYMINMQTLLAVVRMALERLCSILKIPVDSTILHEQLCMAEKKEQREKELLVKYPGHEKVSAAV